MTRPEPELIWTDDGVGITDAEGLDDPQLVMSVLSTALAEHGVAVSQSLRMRCDDCQTTVRVPEFSVSAEGFAAARAKLADDGWTHPEPGTDLCGECSK